MEGKREKERKRKRDIETPLTASTLAARRKKK